MVSFLIIKTSALGDVIQSFGVLDYLKAKFPSCRIDWVVEKAGAPLVSAHPLCDQVFEIDTKLWRKRWYCKTSWNEFKKNIYNLRSNTYDAVFDLQGNAKSAIFTKLAKSGVKVGYGYRSVPEKPNLLATNTRFDIPKNLTVRERYLSLVKQHFKDDAPHDENEVCFKLTSDENVYLQNLLKKMPPVSQKPFYMISFGSNWENKRLKEETLLSFLKMVKHRFDPFFVFIWGNEEEKRQAEDLQKHLAQGLSIGNLTLALWQVLITKMDCMIATDSAGLHLCGTTKTPSFSVFGPSSAKKYKPEGEKHYAFQGVCPYNKVFDKRCPILRTCQSGACMKDIDASNLFDEFVAWKIMKITL